MKLFVTLFLLSISLQGFGQASDSPYLLVTSEDAVIPLKSSSTDVQISGTIAHVTLTQVYYNKGQQALEAKYVFPLSIRAAVHQMQMRIGDRTINAKIFEKQKAQKVYNEAIAEGKRAAKLDQERPNIFQINVGNIMPNDELYITISYTELLVPKKGNYQFVAPGVVGPRFTGENGKHETVFHNPHTAEGIAATFDYDLTLTINAGMLIQGINSTSHKINVNYPNAKTAEVFLSKSNPNPANRDFILNYNLRGNNIQSGLLLYEHEDENFFAYLMEPSITVKPEDIPEREYLFIVDVSGSMNGYPLDVSKKLMRNLLCNLEPTDTFNVQLFASSSTMFSTTPVAANTKNIEAAIGFLTSGQGGGGTQLLDALEQAYKLPRKDEGNARSMVIITDGYVSVEKEAFELIRNHLNEANVFTFGIGSGVNRYLIEGMAKVAQSEAFIATNLSEANKVASAFKTYIATPLLTQVKLKAKGFEIYDVEPASIPDVFAARPVVVYGKYRGKPQGELTLTGYHGKKKFKHEYQVAEGKLSKKNKALRYLWARKKIAELDDYGNLFYEDVKQEVIDLGIRYNLMSKYTSFVAVDEQRVNDNGKLKSVQQPLPLPLHVGSAAIGAAAEVNAKVAYKKSYTIAIDKQMLQSKKRKIKMAVRALYSKVIKEYLKNNAALRISFDASGKLIKIEKLKHGKWFSDETLLTEFLKHNTNKLPIQKSIRVTIKR